MEEEVSPITLKIKKSLWEEFKDGTPRSVTLNDTIVELIEQEVKRRKEEKR